MKTLELEPLERRSVKALSYEGFLREFALPGRPLVLTGVGEEWPARRKWTFDFLKRAADPAEIASIRVCREGGAFSFERMSIGEFFQRVPSPDAHRRRAEPVRYYLANWMFWVHNPALLEDYAPPPFFARDLSELFGFPPNNLSWAFIGEPGTGYRTHIDLASSSFWMFLFEGTKRWRVVRAEDVELLGVNGQFPDLFTPDLEAFPNAHRARTYETVLQPGELIWIPPGCPHHVENPEPSIAVSQNYIDLTNLARVYESNYADGYARKQGVPVESLLASAIKESREQLQELPDLRGHFRGQLREALERRRAALVARQGSLQRVARLTQKLGAGGASQAQELSRSLAALDEALELVRAP